MVTMLMTSPPWSRWWAWWRHERQLRKDILVLCALLPLVFLIAMWNQSSSLIDWAWAGSHEFGEKRLEHIVKVLEGVFYAGSVIAAVVAVVQFVQSARYRRRQDEYEKYVELNNRYQKYLELLTAYPLLVPDEPGIEVPTLSRFEEYRQRQIVDFFFNLAEEAYILRNIMPGRQWTGWDEYIRIHCEIPEFRAYWYVDGTLKQTATLDSNFETYIREILEATG